MGKQFGIKWDALGRYESAKIIPSNEMAVLIVQSLEVSLDLLVGLHEEMLDPATIKRILDLQNPHPTRPRRVHKIRAA